MGSSSSGCIICSKRFLSNLLNGPPNNFENLTIEEDKRDLLRKFFKQLGRYLESGSIGLLSSSSTTSPMKEDSIIEKLIGGGKFVACEECTNVVVKSFCNLFHQMKTIGQLLDSKVAGLKDIMNGSMNAAAQEMVGHPHHGSLIKVEESEAGSTKIVRDFKKKLVEKCDRKLTHSSSTISSRSYHHKAKNCNGNQHKSGGASSSGGMFECDDCFKSFAHEQNLYMHKKITHDGYRYNCGYCSNKTFLKRESAKKHSKRSHTTVSGSPLPFQIDFVVIPGAATGGGTSQHHSSSGGSHSKGKGHSKKKQNATGNSSSYANSSSSSSVLHVQCEFCSERFPDQSSLASHKSSAHEWLRYRCGYCSLTCFDNESAIKSHIEHYHRLPTGVVPPFNFHLVKINENGMVTNVNVFNQMGPTVNNAPPQPYYGSPSTSAAATTATYFFPPTNERPAEVVAHQQQHQQHQQEMGMNLGGGGGVNEQSVNTPESSSSQSSSGGGAGGGKDSKNHLCRICLQNFRSTSQLSAHFKQEHDGKRSKCENCGALFANQHNLMRHLCQVSCGRGQQQEQR